MVRSMAMTSNAAMRKKTPFYVSIFLIRDTGTYMPSVRLTPMPNDCWLWL